MKSCNSRSSGARAGNFITGDMLRELQWAKSKSFLQNETPKALRAGMGFEKFLIFTDAALEQSDTHGSVGMVVFLYEQRSCHGQLVLCGRGVRDEDMSREVVSREVEEGDSCP